MITDAAAFAKFWTFYAKHRDTVLPDAVAQRPVLAQFYASLTDELRELFGPAVVAAAERSIAEGQLTALEEAQRRIGIAFARAGMTYHDVFGAVFELRNVFLTLMDREDMRDPDVMRGLLVYVHNAVLNIGGAFIAARDEMLTQQRRQILELSTPVLQIAPRLLLVPIIGELTEDRLTSLTSRVLAHVRDARARRLILDLTGLAHADSRAASVLGQLVAACRLMGTQVVVSGISSEVATSIVEQEASLAGLDVAGNLEQAVAFEQGLATTGSAR
jgi:rsbT co-antagonist protein RsbR